MDNQCRETIRENRTEFRYTHLSGTTKRGKPADVSSNTLRLQGRSLTPAATSSGKHHRREIQSSRAGVNKSLASTPRSSPRECGIPGASRSSPATPVSGDRPRRWMSETIQEQTRKTRHTVLFSPSVRCMLAEKQRCLRLCSMITFAETAVHRTSGLLAFASPMRRFSLPSFPCIGVSVATCDRLNFGPSRSAVKGLARKSHTEWTGVISGTRIKGLAGISLRRNCHLPILGRFMQLSARCLHICRVRVLQAGLWS